MVVGNGIPDKAEFLMLQKALQDRLLTHAMKAGIVHRTAWEVWEDNWMQAQADLPGADARLVRVVAAYMTLGDYDSQRAGAVLAEALTPGGRNGEGREKRATKHTKNTKNGGAVQAITRIATTGFPFLSAWG